MKYHDVANIFPMMSDDEFKDLVADIKQNGLLEPIWTYDNQIIDGRNRYAACVECGVEPKFRQWNGKGSLVAFVVSLNLKRRHLSSGQKATVAVDVLPLLEQEAKERQLATLKQNNGAGDNPLVKNLTDGKHDENAGKAAEQAAQLVGTNRQYVSDAKKLKEDAPDLYDAVRSGQVAIAKANKELKRREFEAAVPKQKPKVEKSPLIILGKAEQVPELKDNSVDLIITSPPYNLGNDTWAMGGEGRNSRDGIDYDTHDDQMDEIEYQEWQLQVLIEMYRVAREGASFFYNHKVRSVSGTIIHPLDWLRDPRNPWIIRQEIIWDRGSTHNHNPVLFWPEDERIYWMTKGRPVLPDRSIGMSTVWRFFGPVPNTWHPAPFSEELPKKCIEAIGRDGITILDPFCGSGTTLKIALKYGYDAVGIDISEEYIQKAKEENGWT